jgi:hypothetical protein
VDYRTLSGRYLCRHRGNGNSTSNNNDNVVVKQLKQELTDLLWEDAKADKLRSIPTFV